MSHVSARICLGHTEWVREMGNVIFFFPFSFRCQSNKWAFDEKKKLNLRAQSDVSFNKRTTSDKTRGTSLHCIAQRHRVDIQWTATKSPSNHMQCFVYELSPLSVDGELHRWAGCRCNRWRLRHWPNCHILGLPESRISQKKKTKIHTFGRLARLREAKREKAESVWSCDIIYEHIFHLHLFNDFSSESRWMMRDMMLMIHFKFFFAVQSIPRIHKHTSVGSCVVHARARASISTTDNGSIR